MPFPDRVTIHLRALIRMRFPEQSSQAAAPTASNVTPSTNPLYSTVLSRRAKAQNDGWPTGTTEFAQAVLRARKAARLSRANFAVLIGISEGTLRNIEMGKQPVKPYLREWIVLALAKVGQQPGSSADDSATLRPATEDPNEQT